ncbi:YaaC family protein [Micromonospora sp. CA-259024]|uniref:YaaC family protein n=1 Tax=Micromonospora sp. CA-259024 TaxID=3239965 RepID=UPI003D94E2FD
MSTSTWRNLRSLRHDPPGFANGRGARRSTFQAALEQCEQFTKAATSADYATRPLQLFYALSQGSRAVVAASPRIGQSWRVHGHGLSASTEAQQLPEVEVYAKGVGLFQAMATVLDFQALVQDERVRLGDLWPLIPESAWAPLDKQETLSAIMFSPGAWPQHHHLYGAGLAWIRHAVPKLYGQDKESLARHFARYPALDGLSWNAAPNVPWNPNDFAVSLDIHFELANGERPALIQPGSRLVARYGSSDGSWLFITPTVGSMSHPLHPVLAWWATLLALSSLARYEPANWVKMIDINSSPHATAVEHLLDDAVVRIPEMLLNILLKIDDPG